ncbi:MAG: hypothetical protein AAGA68_04515 [Pseudomonadota bacterium]
MSKPRLPNPRPAAITLLALAVLTLFAMLHHPTIGAHAIEEALAEIQRERGLNGLIHGAMILFVLLYHWCFSVLSSWLGASRAIVALARLALHLGVAAYVGAALVSGFAVPELASRIDPSAEGLRTVLLALYSTNQALAKLGTVAFGGAIVLWGLAILPLGNRSALGRTVGAVGVLAGAVMILGLAFGVWSLDVAGMTLVVVILGCWACAAAAWLWRQPWHASADE